MPLPRSDRRPAERREHILVFVSAYLIHLAAMGLYVLVGDLAGTSANAGLLLGGAVAVETPPGATPPAGARALWAARTLLGSGPQALGRTLRHLDATRAGPRGGLDPGVRRVRPDLTGRGTGRTLLDHVLTTTPGAVHLTTADPANVPLYRHFGFTTLGETPLGPPAVTSVVRVPSPSWKIHEDPGPDSSSR
ncbi:hypothetical protein IPZ70_08480 [Streptomyces polychromogenes]|nr:hypothetical protein [Streptomyces polychromogenes]